jgi:hypothetical protein
MRRLSQRILMLALASGALLFGCVGGSKETTAEDKERLKQYVLDAPPAKMPNRLDINYDGKVTLLGYAIEPAGAVPPGGRVKITMYWRSVQKLEEGWNLFTHVIDGAGERILNIDNVGPIREWRDTQQILGPSSWEPGKIYVDEQSFTLPPNVRTDKVQITSGVWRDSDRLKIASGPHDRENRGLVATLTTSGAKAAEAPPTTRVPLVRVDKLDKTTKLTIDGKLDEEAWKLAPTAGPFVDVRTGRPNVTFPVNGSVKILWNDDGMYLGFDVKDADVVGGFKKEDKDPHLWTKDTVEVMVDPEGDGDNKDYYEIQINPQNLVFDSQFDEYNKPKTEPDGPFGHQDWSAKLKSAVSVDGTLDKSDDKDKGYVVEAMIPWKSFSKAKQAPPKPGDIWRMNFYAMEKNGGVAWSAILGQGNFHRASRFGKLLWAEKGWSPPGMAPAPSASAAGSVVPPPPHSGILRNPIDPKRLPKLKLPVRSGPQPQ